MFHDHLPSVWILSVASDRNPIQTGLTLHQKKVYLTQVNKKSKCILSFRCGWIQELCLALIRLFSSLFSALLQSGLTLNPAFHLASSDLC